MMPPRYAPCMTYPITQGLQRDVATLCAGRDRQVGSPGHTAARTHLLARFREIGLAPYAGSGFELAYEVRGTRFVNVVGVVAGRDADVRPVLLGAHYDSVRGTPGADDNAAAIAIALEVAVRLARHPAARPVVIAHFDAEEPPFFHSTAMGSTRFVADQMDGGVHVAIVLDLVGHAIGVPGLEDVIGVMGSESHEALARAVDAHAASFLPVVTLANRFMPDMSDHHAFRLAGAPYLFLTCGQWRHYHRSTDTPDVLDYGKMARVADLLEALVRDAADAEMDGAVEHDTTAIDTEHLRRVLGPQAGVLGLRGPGDFDRVVRQVVGAIQGV
jgi:hypothetical protein